MRSLVFLILALFIVGCAQQSAVAPTPGPGAVAPTPIEPAGTDAAPLTPPTEKVLGEANQTSALEVNTVRCDKATRTITFRFANNDTRRWQMNQDVGWSSPKDLAAVRVFINSYEVNGKNQYTVNGEKYFGPNWPFSKNCGNVEELLPGDDVTCTLSPVPLKSANAVAAGKNEIFIDSPTSHHIIQFLCE